MEKINLLVEEILFIWKKFCELHNQLYDATCREYQFLLSGQTEALDEHLKTKVNIINKIRDIELKRKTLIVSFNSLIGNEEIKNTSELLDYIQCKKANKDHAKHLKKYNDLLINMIKKIQHQNKKNKMFLNKAIYNLRVIREDISGQSPLSTYDAKGKEQHRLTLK